MSNYLVMLENHLTPEQQDAVARLQAVANEHGLNLFLTGRSMRDVLGGLRVQDLDFVVEGSATKLAKSTPDAEVSDASETLKSASVKFASGAVANIITAREETYSKPGGKPKLNPSNIYDHLRTRDFTIHAIALSLSRASRGLLLDPTNGQSDLTRKELSTVTRYGLYDVPARLLQLIRLKAQLGFTVAPKTWSQYENARAEKLDRHISPGCVLEELRQAARHPDPQVIVQAWAAEGLLDQVSPALTTARLNTAGFTKLLKARQNLPFGVHLPIDDFALFLSVLAEKLTQKERSELASTLPLSPQELESWTRLEARSNKLGKEVGATHKPSQIWAALSKAPAERAIFLLMNSTSRSVVERIKNYFTRYIQTAAEVTDAVVQAESGVQPGSPKFEKKKLEITSKRLDARPKKVVVETPGLEEAHSG